MFSSTILNSLGLELEELRQGEIGKGWGGEDEEGPGGPVAGQCEEGPGGPGVKDTNTQDVTLVNV